MILWISVCMKTCLAPNDAVGLLVYENVPGTFLCRQPELSEKDILF